jgi:putative Mg2+ transporter-C (MgtC) family protein
MAQEPLNMFNRLNPFDQQFWIEILISVVCAGIIGAERQLRGKAAGIRTSILICLGTQMFVSIGATLSGPSTDPSRIIGQVITGIGFLGAGVIMAKEGLVKGVTSAAVIWVLAAIGVTIGLGYLMTAIAFTLVTLGVLLGVELLESSFKKLRQGVHSHYHKGKKYSQISEE